MNAWIYAAIAFLAILFCLLIACAMWPRKAAPVGSKWSPDQMPDGRYRRPGHFFDMPLDPPSHHGAGFKEGPLGIFAMKGKPMTIGKAPQPSTEDRAMQRISDVLDELDHQPGGELTLNRVHVHVSDGGRYLPQPRPSDAEDLGHAQAKKRVRDWLDVYPEGGPTAAAKRHEGGARPSAADEDRRQIIGGYNLGKLGHGPKAGRQAAMREASVPRSPPEAGITQPQEDALADDLDRAMRRISTPEFDIPAPRAGPPTPRQDGYWPRVSGFDSGSTSDPPLPKR